MNKITWIPEIYELAQFYKSKHQYGMAICLLSEVIKYTDDNVLLNNMRSELGEVYKMIKQ